MLLKASSLSNAIFVCLMISIFSGCLVLISHYQNLLNTKLNIKESLINTNNATFNYYIQNPDKLLSNQIIESDIFEEDIISLTSNKEWGFFDVLHTKTIFKGDTISRIGLIGSNKSDKKLPTLFVTNYDQSLKLSGNVKIIGKAKIPNASFEQTHINGQIGNSIEINGQQLNSEDKLPQIQASSDLNIRLYKMLNIEDFKSNNIVNSFDSETLVLNISDLSQLGDIIIKGNIIVFSSGNIKVMNTAQINDIVLMAKNVSIDHGFSGNLQIVATKNVIIEENAKLKYPSSIYVENDIDSIKVHLKPSSTFAGGIVINGNTYKGSLKRQLIIDEKSKIFGSVYCYGQTQLQGEVVGQLFTDRFFLKTKTLEYENVILNGTILGDSLPDRFVHLPLFNSEHNITKYEIIKEF